VVAFTSFGLGATASQRMAPDSRMNLMGAAVYRIGRNQRARYAYRSE